MMRKGHQIAACSLALAVIPPAIQPAEGVACGLLALAFSHGWLSPDIDQRGWWRGRHRGITHQLEAVALASGVVMVGFDYLGVWFVGAGIAIGWTSHVLADALFGGVPSILLGGRHGKRVGSHLKTGNTSREERFVRLLLILLVILPLILFKFLPAWVALGG